MGSKSRSHFTHSNNSNKRHKRKPSTKSPQPFPKARNAPPDVAEQLRFIVMHLETIHAAATVAHDALTDRQRITEEPIARVIRECVMNALSVQMDEMREMAGNGLHE